MKTEGYYKVSLYDDCDNEQNRKVLKGILNFKFYSEDVLNKILTDAINLHNSPFLLTCISISEFDIEDEFVSSVNFSELNERLKS